MLQYMTNRLQMLVLLSITLDNKMVFPRCISSDIHVSILVHFINENKQRTISTGVYLVYNVMKPNWNWRKQITRICFRLTLFISYDHGFNTFRLADAYFMMASSNGNILRVTGPLWRESTVWKIEINFQVSQCVKYRHRNSEDDNWAHHQGPLLLT